MSNVLIVDVALAKTIFALIPVDDAGNMSLATWKVAVAPTWVLVGLSKATWKMRGSDGARLNVIFPVATPEELSGNVPRDSDVVELMTCESVMLPATGVPSSQVRVAVVLRVPEVGVTVPV